MSKLTGAQRTKIKLAKLANKKAKIEMLGKQKGSVGIAKELGKSSTGIAASYSTQRGLEHYSDAQVTKKMNSDANKALEVYTNAILGKGSDSSTGNTGNKSTTEVGGSGSALGG